MQNDLLITRPLNAPRQLVWDAWTSPKHLEHWQGAPIGFTVTVHEMDFRVGGGFDLTMHSPDGMNFRLKGIYREIEEPAMLKFTHIWIDPSGSQGPETIVTITFADLGNTTELTLHQSGFDSSQATEGHKQGWDSTFDRLSEYLSTLK